MIQENIFYEDSFFHDLGDLMDNLDIDEDLSLLEDDWSIVVQEGILESMLTLTEDTFYNLAEERFPEDSDRIDKEFASAIKLIDFEKVNAAMPKLYYPDRKKITLTKKDLIDWCK